MFINDLVKQAIFKFSLTVIMSIIFGCLHTFCQHYHHMYCRSNIVLFLLLDESRMCKILHSVSVFFESHATTKFGTLVGHIKTMYDTMQGF